MAEWVRALAWAGDRTVSRPGSNPATVTSLRNFGNSVYPALPVSFGGDTKIKAVGPFYLVSMANARGSKRSHQSALECVPVTVVDSTTHSKNSPTPRVRLCGGKRCPALVSEEEEEEEELQCLICFVCLGNCRTRSLAKMVFKTIKHTGTVELGCVDLSTRLFVFTVNRFRRYYKQKTKYNRLTSSLNKTCRKETFEVRGTDVLRTSSRTISRMTVPPPRERRHE